GQTTYSGWEREARVPRRKEHDKILAALKKLKVNVDNTPFERMEVFMEGLFFAIGFLLGGVVGVLIMCLLQINRIINYPLYCPKCKRESLIQAKQLHIVVIKEPDA